MALTQKHNFPKAIYHTVTDWQSDKCTSWAVVTAKNTDVLQNRAIKKTYLSNHIFLLKANDPTTSCHTSLKQIVDQIIPEFGMYFIKKIRIFYVFLGKIRIFNVHFWKNHSKSTFG